MQSNSTRYYLLGAAVAAFDPDGHKITPGAINNLLNIPGSAAIVLRHVWPEMMNHERAGELLGRIEWPDFRPSIQDSGSYAMGYYHQRSCNKDAGDFRTINPSCYAILYPESVPA